MAILIQPWGLNLDTGGTNFTIFVGNCMDFVTIKLGLFSHIEDLKIWPLCIVGPTHEVPGILRL